MNSDSLQIRIVFLTLQPVGSILLVFSGDVTRHSGNTTFFLLGALEDNLYPGVFGFLCHNSLKLINVNKTFLTSLAQSCFKTVFLYRTHTLGGNAQSDEPVFLL